jgi:hypothetical protein
MAERIRHVSLTLPRPNGPIDPASLERAIAEQAGAVPLRWAVVAIETAGFRIEAAVRS